MCGHSLHCEPRGGLAQCQVFSDLLHMLKDSTKTQIISTFSRSFRSKNMKMLPSLWCRENRNLLNEGIKSDTICVHEGPNPGFTRSEFLLDVELAIAHCGESLMRTATPVAPPCVTASLQWDLAAPAIRGGNYFPTRAPRLGHMTDFDQWDGSKRDASRSLMSLQSWAWPALLPGTLPCHVNKPGLASGRVRKCTGKAAVLPASPGATLDVGVRSSHTTLLQTCQAKSGELPADPHNFE